MTEVNQKKRHHYVPITFLNRFTDKGGRVFAYRKDGPQKPLRIRPSEIAFERYYYSQPMPEGGQDNNRLEDLFSEVETQWPGLVDDLSAQRDVHDRAEALFNFISLLRVRGPAARDPVELYLAHKVRRQMRQMADAGSLPPLPAELTMDEIEIAIDPHQSIHAMVLMLQGLARLWEHIGLEVVHNTTAEPFATSDNPVVYFDPDVREERVLPYMAQPPGQRVELLVPISPTVMLRGGTDLPVIGARNRLRHVEMRSRADVCRVNRFIARFGYRFVFANHGGLEGLVSKHGALSPTVQFDIDMGNDLDKPSLSQMVFGPRHRKPKWQARQESPGET